MTYHTQLTIRAGDTDVIEILVSPPSALDGARVLARMWLGRISEPRWHHSWDTREPAGIEVVDGTIRLATAGAPWHTAPNDRAFDLTLEIKIARGDSVETLPHFPVRALPRAIVFPAPSSDPESELT